MSYANRLERWQWVWEMGLRKAPKHSPTAGKEWIVYNQKKKGLSNGIETETHYGYDNLYSHRQLKTSCK